MEPTHEPYTVSLPEGLRRQFADFERRLWSAESTTVVSRVFAALAASFLLLFLSDRVWDTPAWLRLVLTVAGIGTAVIFALQWVRHWVWQRRDLRALSLLVQRQHRRLGDRLLGIVELSDESKRPEGMSPTLCRAAIQQVSEEAQRYDFLAAIDRQALRASLLAGTAALALVLAPSLLAPAAVWNAAQRWLVPVANIERYTFVDLSQLPGHVVSPHGEAFDLAGQVRYRSFWKPQGVTAWFENEAMRKSRVESEQIHLKLEGRTEKTMLVVRIGDARRRIEVEPMHRPFLKEITASIQLPPYLKHPVAEESVQQGALNTLGGSKVILRGKANRPLQSVSMQAEGSREPFVKLTGDTFEIGPLDVGRDARWQLTWRDQLGLSNGSPWPIAVQARADQPPQVQIEELSLEVAILETDVLPIKVVAQDDYGIQKTGIAWDVITTGPEAAAATTSSVPHEAQRPAVDAQQRRVRETFVFSPSIMRVPADSVVDLRAFTTDYFPGRPMSESAHYRIQVVGLVQHAEWMRQQFEALFAQLEEVTRRQEAIANSTAELKQQSNEKLEATEAGKQADKQAGDQQQNARSLEQLSNEGSKMLREAFRNPTFNEQTLREWAQNLQAMQSIAKGGMQKASDELQWMKKREEGDQRRQQLAQALMTEQEALRDLAALQKKMNQGLDNLQAQTLAQRLRQLATEQKKIRDQMNGMISETIGMLPDQLPPRYQRANVQLAENQSDNQKTATTLQSEINRFYERTGRENYGSVSTEMKENNTGDELDRIRGLVQSNVGMEAIRNLGVWTKHFDEWADKLEPKQESSSGSGSGSGSPQDDTLMKMLVAFLRLRQQEANLYERTKLLDQNRPAGEAYEQTAKDLSKSQFKMRNEVGRIQTENQLPLLDEPLDHTFQSMREVEASLSRPETGDPTAQAQTKTIENLTDLVNLLNEQAKKNSSSSQQQQQQQGSPTEEEMAFLLQMMQQQGNQVGMKPGMQPGGNRNGGDTKGLPPVAPGEVSGAAPESRTASKASGQTRTLPTEFREALENYFKAVEQKE